MKASASRSDPVPLGAGAPPPPRPGGTSSAAPSLGGLPGLQTVSVEDVDQLTHDGASVRLRKERLLLDDRIAIVRKRLPGSAGPRVVLVHGFAQNRYSWHLSRRSLSAWLAGEGFDVLNLELPGHGNSRSPAGSACF